MCMPRLCVSHAKPSPWISFMMSPRASASRAISTNCWKASDTFIELVDARAATVRMLTDNGHTRLVASRGLSAEVVEKDRLMDTSLCQCGWAAKEGGIRTQRGTDPCAKLLGTPMLKRDCQEFVVVPVTYQDRIVGVYNLFLDRPISALGEDINDLLNS